MQEEFRKGYLDYSEAAGIITISHASKKRLLEIGLPDNLVHVVHNGVEIPARSPARRGNNASVSCLAVGRMTNIKAPILLLESFCRAYEQCPALRLDYVGGGELLAAAMQYVKCHGLGEVVRLHGVKDSGFVQEMMRSADIFVQHSATDPTNGDMEGLPVAILEAMANALPVVSTRHAGIPEQVVEGETGFLVEECDAGAMAESIVRLAKSPDLRRSMGEAGYVRAKEHFSWELNRKRLCEVMGLEP
jgi:glycosyltransferase involved in cell wall biosynthesis